MSSTTLIIIGVVIVAILLVAARVYSRQQAGRRQQRTGQLRELFGSEYDRTLADKGDAGSAERELSARQKRVSSFNIKPLGAEESQRFTNEWLAMKASFVDDPSAAVRDAEAILERVLDARGYPAGDFEQRSADVSVDHAKAIEFHRAAHEISLRQAKGEANTEDLRRAVIDDHDLFAELVGEPVMTPAAAEAVAETGPEAEKVGVVA